MLKKTVSIDLQQQRFVVNGLSPDSSLALYETSVFI